MAAGRSNRVLFDLIPHRDAEPARAKSPAPAPTPAPTPTTTKPVVRVELKPQDAPASAPSSPRAATPYAPHAAAAARAHEPLPRAAGMPPSPQATPHPTYAAPARPSPFRWPSFLGTNSLAIPLNLIYLSVAALVILAVAFFIWGRSAGWSAAIDKLGSATPDIPAVVEPDANSPRLLPPTTPTSATPATNPPAGSSRRAGTPPTSPVTPAANPAAPAPLGAILTGRGPVMTDPRVAELNYLSLASLGEADANAAIAFLAANGIDAIGVPRVDPSAAPANNQGPTQVYRIYALPGITRDEYAQKLTARTNLEAAVAKVGATWQRDHRGASNFARTQWEKFRP